MAASGSILVARRAGRMQAAIATPIITSTATTMFAASVAVSPKSKSAMALAVRARGQKSVGGAGAKGF